MSTPNFPTETVTLPSKGLVYPKDHPFRSGVAEMKYMTAREEDILTNQNYLEKGIILDKMLESLLIADVDVNKLVPGDKNALLIASRILGYGKDYTFMWKDKEVKVDLTTLKPIDFPKEGVEITENGTSYYTLPKSGDKIEFKFLTDYDYDKIDEELEALKKLNPNDVPSVTTNLKHRIVSINGNSDKSYIFNFVRNQMLAIDSMNFRKHCSEVSPQVDLNVKVGQEEVDLPIGLNFFWPEF